MKRHRWAGTLKRSKGNQPLKHFPYLCIPEPRCEVDLSSRKFTLTKFHRLRKCGKCFKNCRMRSENRKYELKESRNSKNWYQCAEDADRAAHWQDSRRGNFSFYPTLFIASQEMFVNCEFRALTMAQLHSGSRRMDPITRPGGNRSSGEVPGFRSTGTNDIQSGR